MGIDICKNKKVTYSDKHEKRVNTSVNTNPTISKIPLKPGLLTVYSIFKRVSSQDRKDGNPLIYALKTKKNYTIEHKELLKFKPNFIHIIKKFSSDINHKKCILVVLPSSSNVASIFARRVGRILSIDVIYDAFSKCTIGEVLNNFQTNTVRKNHDQDVREVIAHLRKKNKDLTFAMKDIANHIRYCFCPLKLNISYDFSGYDVILVDDLLSTGTTLISSHNLLKNKCNKIIGLTLLGNLK